MVGRRKAADSRGEFFGSAAGIGDGASAWDFQPSLFAWRKAYREGRFGDIAGFVPAVIVPEQPEKVTGTGLSPNRDCERERPARYCRLRRRRGEPTADHAWA